MKKRWITLVKRIQDLKGLYVVFSAPDVEIEEIETMLQRALVVPDLVKTNQEKAKTELLEINDWLCEKMSYLDRGAVKIYQEEVKRRDIENAQRRQALSDWQWAHAAEIMNYIKDNDIKLDNI